ncbi:heterotetrameric sarcosine oxidase gamma subunit [Natronocella acetinitrilica]|uniref:Heterotetrameric sarcosine oxidase gamma subunit n=1 Tax=Natronocella acetinitrilica TaxID=414046 RepID=A0AAE3G3Q8_9GAMM|nr:heterotetrameric sarcosine oxidase gamma subunit [Natronocella acetinitrilica]
MAEQDLRYPVGLSTWQLPAQRGEPGVRIAHVRGLACCQVFARRGREDAVQAALNVTTAPGRGAMTRELLALPLAPRQWMILAPRGRDGALARALAQKLDGIGHVSDQSHGRAAFRVSGRHAVELLGRECRLDLATAEPGFAGQTVMAEISVLLCRPDAESGFVLLVYPGYAQAFLGWLQQAAASMQPLFVEEDAPPWTPTPQS